MKPQETEVGALYKILTVRYFKGWHKAFPFQMRDCGFCKVMALYYKQKLTCLPTLLY